MATFYEKETGSHSKILGPLTLESPPLSTVLLTNSVSCLCCDNSFNFPSDQDQYLAHLYLEHKLVIADVDEIADLKEYLEYWFQMKVGNNLEEYCTTLLLDQLPNGNAAKDEKYYLLSDILPQDYELRKKLVAIRLEKVLQQHQTERSDNTFTRECLYCRDVITGLRAEYLEHLFNKHFLQLGKPENLVYIDDLIDTVQKNLDNLICLYCKKVFKDRVILKEHMRKKGHKRINPADKFYDKFFLINYKIEKPQNRKAFHKKKDANFASMQRAVTRISFQKGGDHEIMSNKANNADSDSDSNWSDWDEGEPFLTCLFCPKKEMDFGKLKNHIKIVHSLDFDAETEGLNIYQKIKVVNYIRRQVHLLRCVVCNERHKSLEELDHHMTEQRHYSIGGRTQWDHPQYFFPTFEDDGILCLLDNGNDSIDEDNSVVVISEDITASINKEAEKLSLENFEINRESFINN